MSRPIKLCIVNRNYPPQKGATGYQAFKLVEWLTDDGRFEIVTVSAHSGNDKHPQYYIKNRYNGKSKIRRLFSALIESYQLIKRAKNMTANIYLILTDPPFLNFWATRLLKDEYWINWTMDLYPEAFVANKLVAPQNRLLKFYEAHLRRHSPKHLICLGPAQLEYLRRKYYPKISATILPAGLRENPYRQSRKGIVPEWANHDKIVLGYIGSIGEAHDADALFNIAVNLDPERLTLVLSCYGSKAKGVLNKLRTFPSVICLDYLPEPEMSLLDVQIVSLMPEWTHICVPSKALSAISHRNAVLYIGEKESDTWHYIKPAGWGVSSTEELVKWIRSVMKSDVLKKRERAEIIAKNLLNQRNQAYAEIAGTLIKLIE